VTPDIRRHAERVVAEALTDTRCVIVNGARQVGKSTLVRAVTKGDSAVLERRLDRTADRAAAMSDPERFVRHDGLVVVDEIQRVPELILAVKASVDEDRRPGRFLITGSARLLGLRGLPDALVGRSETIELWPFSQGEMQGTLDSFVDNVFAEPTTSLVGDPHSRDDYVSRAIRGGYPEAVNREPGRRQKFFASYVSDLIDRDVMQLSEIQRRPELHRLLNALAARMATLLKVETIASELMTPKSTIERYIALLEEVFVIKRIPAWSNSMTKRALQMPKVLLVDSGLGASLAGMTIDRVRRQDALAGPLLENFAIGEIARQLTWSATPARLYHYRNSDGQEVDVVLETNDGRVVGIEVKASETPPGDAFRHLEHLRRATGDRFHQGIVLYTGTQTLSFGDRLTAVPLSALWANRSPSDGLAT
jgi:uncharacterized protein